MLKLATEEFIAEKVFKYLISFDYDCKKSKLTLNFSISIISFCITVQSIWI